jgi:hypothetical protein
MSIQTQQTPQHSPPRPRRSTHPARKWRRVLAHAPSDLQTPPLAARITPRGSSRREMAALETTMANLALDARHAVALELAGDSASVSFVVRADTAPALAHLVSQLQALYPQARIDFLARECDPLRLAAHEAYSVVELGLGAPSYLSLRTWDARAWEQRDAEGADPLLAVLSALQHLPHGTRAVTQLAMLPASPTWSAPYARKAVEHPLEPERDAERKRKGESSRPSAGLMGVLAVIVAFALLWRREGSRLLPLIPLWVKQDVPLLIRGHVPSLTPPELLQLALIIGCLLCGALVVSRLLERLRGKHPLYDMKQVGEKTKRVAYRARLRLYVIGERGDAANETPRPFADESDAERETPTSAAAKVFASMLASTLITLLRRWQSRFARSAVPPVLHGAAWLRRFATRRSLPSLCFPHRASDVDEQVQDVAADKPDGQVVDSTVVYLLPAIAECAESEQEQAALPRISPPILNSACRCSQSSVPGKRGNGHNNRTWKKACVQARRLRKAERQHILARLVASYRQYHQPWGNYLTARTPHLRHAHLLAAAAPARPASTRPSPNIAQHCRRLVDRMVWGKPRWDKDVARSPYYLSVAELAALWHLPPEHDIPDVPFLEHGGARTRLVPQVLTGQARTSENTESMESMGVTSALVAYQMGSSTHAGQCWPVFVPRDLLHTNTLTVAATGKGKSTLFQHLSLAHLAANPSEGLLFMEPHGDTIATLLGAIPASRKEDVTLIDLADKDTVVSLNPLDMTQGIGRDKTVENILAVFVAFWQKQRSWGPRTENLLQFALLTLAEANQTLLSTLGEEQGAASQYTILDVMPLLQHAPYRSSILKDVHDSVLLSWWTTYYNSMRQGFRDEVISPVINKISKYAAAQVSRRLLGQSRATIRLREDIAEGRPILINTASGIVGEEVSALAGATFVGLFQAALAEQSRLALRDRRRFLVFVDEFQTYLGIDYPTMLAELRKYGGAFGLATQSLSYLHEVDPALKATVLSNIDHLFAFAMSAEDAKTLAPYLDGLEIADVLSLDSYTCYARLTHQGARLPTFSMQVAPPPERNGDYAAWIRRHATERTARPVQLVDEELRDATCPPRTPLPKDAALHALDDSGDDATQGEPQVNADEVPTRERGKRTRGNRGNSARSTADSADPPESSERFDHPAVLSPRMKPRSGRWFHENEERAERGEPGGE